MYCKKCKKKCKENFCSTECERRFKINEKISTALKGKEKRGITLKCVECKDEYYRIPSKVKDSKFCSRTCSTTFKNKNVNLAQKAGLASALKQNKRSKNEIYFAELCKGKFKNVKENERLFNGWDADVIIEDLKIAILWNGPWHYKKITRKHSLKQVQQRDKIKLKQIENCGYIAYVIKDDGKHNKNFVETEFENFLTNACSFMLKRVVEKIKQHKKTTKKLVYGDAIYTLNVDGHFIQFEESGNCKHHFTLNENCVQIDELNSGNNGTNFDRILIGIDAIL